MIELTDLPGVKYAVRVGDYGTVIRLARTLRGWSLADAGKALGYDASSLSRIERGLQHPSLLDLRRVADVLHIPIGMLGLSAEVLPSAQDRLVYAHRSHGQYVDGDETRLVAAEMATPPDVVADHLAAERGALALRREHLTLHVGRPVRRSTTWVSAKLAAAVPELLAGRPGDVVATGISGMIEAATGRIAKSGYDIVSPWTAMPYDAETLDCKVGVALLRTETKWRDASGVIQWVETITRQRVGYSYSVR